MASDNGRGPCGWCGVEYSPELDGKACVGTIGFLGCEHRLGPTGPHQWTVAEEADDGE